MPARPGLHCAAMIGRCGTGGIAPCRFSIGPVPYALASDIGRGSDPAARWRLGNLKTDGVDRVLQRFQYNEVPGLHVNFQVPVSQLARMYGRNNSHLMYSRGDLIFWWMHKWGEEQWHKQ